MKGKEVISALQVNIADSWGLIEKLEEYSLHRDHKEITQEDIHLILFAARKITENCVVILNAFEFIDHITSCNECDNYPRNEGIGYEE